MFRIRGFSQLLLLAVALAILSGTARAEKRVALLVGINNYLNRGLDTKPLEFAERDVASLEEALTKSEFQVTTLLGRKATKAAIEEAIDKTLTGLTARDIVFIGFAGHGAQMPFRDANGKTVIGPTGEEMEDAFFCPSDARVSESNSLVSLTGLLNDLRNKGGINLVMVDACRDNPDPGRGARSISGNELNGRLPSNTSIVFSCAAGQQALESKDAGGGHGIFFHHVLEGLSGQAADDQGVVAWDDLVMYVRRNVDKYAKKSFPDLARSLADRRELEPEMVRLQTPHELRNMIENPVLVRAPQYRPAQPIAGIRVGRNEEYQTINDALKAARSGATVIVTPGTYNEGVQIEKPVTLIAEGRPGAVIVENSQGSCFVITADEATLRGFTINCRGGAEEYFYGVDVQAGKPIIEECDITSTSSSCIAVRGVDSQAMIRKNKIHAGNKSGVFLYDASHATLQDNDIYDTALAALEAKSKSVCVVTNTRMHDSREGGGVYIYEEAEVTVQRCEIFNNAKANAECQTKAVLIIKDSQIYNSKECGFFFYDEGMGTITNCKVYGNGLSGLEAKTGSAPMIKDTQFYRGQGSGLYFHENAKGTVENCDVYENTISGIAIATGAAPVIRNTKVRDGGNTGIHIYEAGLGLIESCDVANNEKSGIEIREKSNPTIRRTRVHDGKSSGFFVYDEATGIIEDCDVYRNAFGGISVKGKGAPLVRRTRFYDGTQSGIFIYEDGLGTFENCEARANKLANIEIRERGAPTIRNCKIYDGIENGIRIYEDGAGTITDCEIWNNGLGGIGIETRSNPTIRKCVVRDGKQGGVVVTEDARGLIEDCDIYGNGLAGLELKTRGNPTVRRCRIHDGKQCGVYAYEDARGTLEDCDVYDNTYVGMQVESRSSVTVKNSRVVRNRQYGIWVRDSGTATVNNSDITGNDRGSFLNEGGSLRQSGNRVDTRS